jgi:hypothetical protein
MICEDKNIQIIEIENAHNHFLASFPLVREIDVVTGIFATACIPVNGAVDLNGFREQGQFRFPLVSLKFNNDSTTYNVPIHFTNIQGYLPGEEGNANYNRQLLFKPVTIYEKIKPNTFLKVKYRDSLAEVRFIHNLNIYLRYIDK